MDAQIDAYFEYIFAQNPSLSLGSTELNLVSLPPPTKTHKECHLDIYDTPLKDRISIFDKKKIKGFWPVFEINPDGDRELTVSCNHDNANVKYK